MSASPKRASIAECIRNWWFVRSWTLWMRFCAFCNLRAPLICSAQLCYNCYTQLTTPLFSAKLEYSKDLLEKSLAFLGQPLQKQNFNSKMTDEQCRVVMKFEEKRQ